MGREKRTPSPGFGERVAERLHALGYWYADKDEPNVQRFADDHQIRYQYVHAYIYKGRMPGTPESIGALARMLRADPAWLVFGAPAAAKPEPLHGVAHPEYLPVFEELQALASRSKELTLEEEREVIDHLVRQLRLLVRERRGGPGGGSPAPTASPSTYIAPPTRSARRHRARPAKPVRRSR